VNASTNADDAHAPVVRRSALVGHVIEALQHGITSGRWPVGARLPTETDLAAELGVSRMTFRQGVQALVHAGLLQTIQGNGTFVRATTEVEAVLGRYLAGEDLISILEVREAIEVVTAGLAAERRTDSDLADMEAALAEETAADAAGDLTAVAAASSRFHTAVVNASGNPIFVHFYAAMQAGATKAIATGAGPQTRDEFRAEHRVVIDAIRDGASRRAREAMQAHLQPVIDEIKGRGRGRGNTARPGAER
jgi:DNA-binding FadR family transcriptional regulator